MNFLKEVFISLLFMFFVTEKSAFTNEDNCGLTSNKANIHSERFIVGGSDALIEDFPFMVSLQLEIIPEIFFHFCGGAILNKRWILTAAHCIKMSIENGYLDSPSQLRVIIGQTKNRHLGKNSTFVYKVEKWVIHGCFHSKSYDEIGDDITLLKTAKDIDFNRNNVRPICLPPKNVEPISVNMTLAGWGTWTESYIGFETSPETLQMTKTMVVSEEFCLIYEKFRNIWLSSWTLGHRLCLREEKSTPCRGDSGGPVFQEVKGRYYHFGIASFISSVPPFHQCYKSNPALYLKTSHYIDWITESIEKYENSRETKIETKC